MSLIDGLSDGVIDGEFTASNDAWTPLVGVSSNAFGWLGTSRIHVDSRLSSATSRFPKSSCLELTAALHHRLKHHSIRPALLSKPLLGRVSLCSGLQGLDLRLSTVNMPPTRYDRLKPKLVRDRLTSDEGESSTGQDVELGQIVRTHEPSASIPSAAKGPGQSDVQRPSLSLEIPSFPSSSSSIAHARRSSWQPWSSTRKRQRPSSRFLSKIVNVLKLSMILL